LIVLVSTSRFWLNLEEVYSATASSRLSVPTLYTLALIVATRDLLESSRKRGTSTIRAEYSFTDIVVDAERQQSLILPADGERHLRLMETVDRITHKHGRHTLRPLPMGKNRRWEMKCGRPSGRHTTRLNEVLRVKAC
jgi:DNA polymerase V